MKPSEPSQPTPVSFLELLPFHPKVKPGESFSSYINRLAHMNCFRKFSAIRANLFPETTTRLSKVTDVPPLSFSRLSRITNQTEEDLLATTFHYISANFGRSTKPQAVSRFLTGLLGDSLRFCPECLREDNYYRLIWRFNPIEKCILHRCQLLDQCFQCRQPISLLAPPFHIGVCPKCGADQRKAKVIYSDNGQSITEFYTRIFSSFLTNLSLQDENYKNFSALIGMKITLARISQSLTIDNLAQMTQMSPKRMYGIECGKIIEGTGKFSDYLLCMKLLKLSIDEVVSTEHYTHSPITSIDPRELSQKEIDNILIEAQQYLITHNLPITILELSKATGIPFELIRESINRNQITGYRHGIKKQIEDEEDMLASMKTIMEEYYPGQPYITDAMLASRMGMNLSHLHQNPKYMAFLIEMKQNLYGFTHLRGHRSRQILPEEIDELKVIMMEDLTEISIRKANRLLEISQSYLNKHPDLFQKLKIMLNDLRIIRKQQELIQKAEKHIVRDDELVEMIDSVHSSLASNSEEVTQKAILEQMGINRKYLARHPKAYAHMKHIIALNKAKTKEKKGNENEHHTQLIPPDQDFCAPNDLISPQADPMAN